MKMNIRIFMSFMCAFIILISIVSVPIAKGEALDVKSKIVELEREIIEAARNGDDDEVISLSNDRKFFQNIVMELDQLHEEIDKAARNRDVDELIALSIKRKEIKQLLEKDGINKVSSNASFKNHNKWNNTVVPDNKGFGGVTDGGVAYGETVEGPKKDQINDDGSVKSHRLQPLGFLKAKVAGLFKHKQR